jgi:phage replication O-like protein O
MLTKINHTQTSNDFIDNHMKNLSGAATKVFLAISRKTIGWHKDTDFISLSQIMSITGLSNKGSIKAIKELEENNLIIVTRNKNENNRNFTNKYELNYEQNTVASEQKSQGSEKSSPKGSEKSSQTKESNKETLSKEKDDLVTIKLKAFERWWDMYDKKVSRAKTEKKFLSLKSALYNDILSHTKEYVKSTPDKVYRKNPLTYLNNECWEDEIVKKENHFEYEVIG